MVNEMIIGSTEVLSLLFVTGISYDFIHEWGSICTGRGTVDKYVERKSKTCYTQYSWFSFQMNLPNNNDTTQI